MAELTINNLRKSFGNFEALKNIFIAVEDGEFHLPFGRLGLWQDNPFTNDCRLGDA